MTFVSDISPEDNNQSLGGAPAKLWASRYSGKGEFNLSLMYNTLPEISMANIFRSIKNLIDIRTTGGDPTGSGCAV